MLKNKSAIVLIPVFLFSLPGFILSGIEGWEGFGEVAAQEICDNGTDDDADGLTDLNDTVDCICTLPPLSFIKNPSFEQMDSCPTHFTSEDYPDQFDRATDWTQANYSTTADYYNCTYLNKSALMLGIKAQEGSGMVGIIVEDEWREYIGQCLDMPLLAGKTYTMHLQIASSLMPDVDGQGNPNIPFAPTNIALYGSSNCSTLPFGGDPPYPAWKIMGRVYYTPSPAWETISITFTPATNIQGIAIGGDSVFDASYTQYVAPNIKDPSDPEGVLFHPYFYLDNLILNESTPDPFIDITSTGSYCTGSFVLTAHTSIAGGSWQWYKEGVAISGQKDSVLNVSAINNADFGVYTARYLSGGKCFTRDFKYELSKYEAFGVKANVGYSSLCYGSNGYITLVGTGAYSYTYTWDYGIIDGGASGTTSTVFIDDFLTPSSSFPAHLNFIVTGTDAMGCKGADTVELMVLNKAQVFLTDTIYKCNTDLAFVLPGSMLFNPQINESVQAYPARRVIDSAGTFFYPDSAVIGLNFVQWRLRPDTATCWSDKRTYVMVGKPDTSSAGMLGKDTSIAIGSTITLNAADKAINWTWSTTETTPSITVSPTDTTTYCVTVTLTSGCQASDCIVVNAIKKCGDVFVPTAFSPNNDGSNEMECVLGAHCTQTFRFLIYDRWGEKVFETDKPEICWNGMYKGKPMNTAVFVYYLEGTLTNGTVLSKKGNISLIR